MAMASWGIALGIITMVGTVILIVVLVAGSTHPANVAGSTSGWDRATHFGLDQSYYTSAFQEGKVDYQFDINEANLGEPVRSAEQECHDAGNAGQIQACKAGFNVAVAANGPIQNPYQKGYKEGVAYAQQEMQTAAQGGVPNGAAQDCDGYGFVAGEGNAVLPATTSEEKGCIAGFNATYPNEFSQ
jgi:hypothetical protein